MRKVIGVIRRLAERGRSQLSTDDELFDRFFDGRDEHAFAEIVERHGPMVFGVCLRLLSHRQSAEDAFQATFLTLVKKGHTIRQRRSLSFWLYRVAYRISLSQRSRLGRHPEQSLTDEIAVIESHDAAWHELRSTVDAELHRLPPRYRSVMILCALEGKTYDEAARELGCPKGTVAIRLLRAREILKRRLMRRGLLAGAGGLATCVTIPQALAAVPAGLAAATASAAVAVAQGAAIASVVSLAVASLVRAAGRDLWQEKCKSLVVLLALIGFTGTAASMTAQTHWLRQKSRTKAFGSTSVLTGQASRTTQPGTSALHWGGAITGYAVPATNNTTQRQKAP